MLLLINLQKYTNFELFLKLQKIILLFLYFKHYLKDSKCSIYKSENTRQQAKLDSGPETPKIKSAWLSD